MFFAMFSACSIDVKWFLYLFFPLFIFRFSYLIYYVGFWGDGDGGDEWYERGKKKKEKGKMKISMMHTYCSCCRLNKKERKKERKRTRKGKC